MNDEEIKKCLECCVSLSCEGCPLKNNHGCLAISDENALDLISRQQAEIEQLKRNLSQCENGYSQELHLARRKIEELKSLCTSEDKLIKELRAENERLQKQYDKAMDDLKALLKEKQVSSDEKEKICI